ncbi:MAG: CDP-alcohol phosphatidyltransferase family protein [Clostridiales bacterium]|nr:CDP-alcohol phosphatidyltransferase family protein [Clostridiales bacterium]
MLKKVRPFIVTKVKTLKEEVFTIPNILSFFRITLIPFIVIFYLSLKKKVLASILVLISGVTDLLDGFIARKFNLITDLGKILDPIADKLTQLTVLFCLIIPHPLMIIPFLLLFLKEILAGIVGLILIKKEFVPFAVWHGKLSTAFLYLTMFLHLIWVNIPFVFSKILIFISSSLIILSFILYTIKNLKKLTSLKNVAKN